jgi:hypothetical protein
MAPKSRFSAMRKITVLIVSMRTPASGKPRVGYRWSVGFLQPSVYSRYASKPGIPSIAIKPPTPKAGGGACGRGPHSRLPQSLRTSPDRPRRAPENESHAVRRRNSLSTKIPKLFSHPAHVEYGYTATNNVAKLDSRRSSTPRREGRP